MQMGGGMRSPLFDAAENGSVDSSLFEGMLAGSGRGGGSSTSRSTRTVRSSHRSTGNSSPSPTREDAARAAAATKAKAASAADKLVKETAARAKIAAAAATNKALVAEANTKKAEAKAKLALLSDTFSPGATIEILGMEKPASKRLNGKRGIVSQEQTRANLDKGRVAINLGKNEQGKVEVKTIKFSNLRVLTLKEMEAEAFEQRRLDGKERADRQEAAERKYAADRDRKQRKQAAEAEHTEREVQATAAVAVAVAEKKAKMKAKLAALTKQLEEQKKATGTRKREEAKIAAADREATHLASVAAATAAARQHEPAEGAERIKSAAKAAREARYAELSDTFCPGTVVETFGLHETQNGKVGVIAPHAQQIMANLTHGRTLVQIDIQPELNERAEADSKTLLFAYDNLRLISPDAEALRSRQITERATAKAKAEIAEIPLEATGRKRAEATVAVAKPPTVTPIPTAASDDDADELPPLPDANLSQLPVQTKKKRGSAFKISKERALLAARSQVTRKDDTLIHSSHQAPERAASLDNFINADQIKFAEGSIPLGSGASGQVYKGTWSARKHEEPMPVAIKVFQGMDFSKLALEDRKPIVDEIKLGITIQSECLVRTFGWTDHSIYGFSIVLEMVDGGTLFAALSPPQYGGASKPTLAARIGWLVDTATGMKCLYVCTFARLHLLIYCLVERHIFPQQSPSDPFVLPLVTRTVM
jgi:hypothetical protein